MFRKNILVFIYLLPNGMMTVWKASFILFYQKFTSQEAPNMGRIQNDDVVYYKRRWTSTTKMDEHKRAEQLIALMN